MFPELETDRRFVQRNVQPESKTKLPLCPNYKLIEICAMLAGIEPETLVVEELFCGHQVEYEDNMGFLSGHRGNNYKPKTKCTEIRDCLLKMLHQAQEEVSLPGGEMTRIIESNSDLLKKEESLRQALEQTSRYNEKQRILGLWKKAVYEITCVPPDPSQESDPHFRRRTIEELTDEEVLETVQKLLHALEDQVTGEGSNWYEGPFVLDSSRARHCPQTPHSFQTGAFS